MAEVSAVIMEPLHYILTLAACVAITLPLEALAPEGVYRQPGRLSRAIALPAAVFLVWDAVAVARDHWAYDPNQVLGWTVPGSLPIEEVLFFLVIPVCAVLTFEAVRGVSNRWTRWRRRRAGLAEEGLVGA